MDDMDDHAKTVAQMSAVSEKTVQEGSSLYYALLHVPAAVQQQLLAVLRLCTVLSNTLNEVTEPSVAEKKIHWWHEEITRLHAGESRHPATQAVEPLLHAYEIEPQCWLAILSANNDEKFINAVDDTEYQQRLQKGYHARIQICSRILQGHDHMPSTHWAAALGEVDRLRQFHRLYNHGYPVLPDEDYARQSIEPTDVRVAEKRAQVSALFTHRIELTISALQRALSEPDPAMRTGSLPFYTLATLRKAQLDLWLKQALLPSEAYATLTPLRKAWLAWRCRTRYRGKIQ